MLPWSASHLHTITIISASVFAPPSPSRFSRVSVQFPFDPIPFNSVARGSITPNLVPSSPLEPPRIQQLVLFTQPTHNPESHRSESHRACANSIRHPPSPAQTPPLFYSAPKRGSLLPLLSVAVIFAYSTEWKKDRSDDSPRCPLFPVMG